MLGHFYVQSPAELRSPQIWLISIKNNDHRCFLWCHVRHLKHAKMHPERITQNEKKFVNDLDYDRVEFPVREKDFIEIETKDKICINVFC